MGLLQTKIDTGTDTHRIYPVTTKLTKKERVKVTEFAKLQGHTRGEWMRGVILREIENVDAQDSVNKVLTEIVGVQLLLMNVLKPIVTGQPMTAEAFDRIVQQTHNVKHEIAERITREGE